MNLAPRHDDVLGGKFGTLHGEIVDRALHRVSHSALAESGPDFDFRLRAGRHALQQRCGSSTKPSDLRHAHASGAAAKHLQHIAPAELLVVSFRHDVLLIIVLLITCLHLPLLLTAPPSVHKLAHFFS